MKIFYCEVCNARLSPEDLPLGAEPYDETKTIHYCEKHKPAFTPRPLRPTSNANLKALTKSSSNPNLRAVGGPASPLARRTPSGSPQLRRTPGAGGATGSGIRSGPTGSGIRSSPVASKGSGIRPSVSGSGIRPSVTGSGIRSSVTGSGIRPGPTGSGIRAQPPAVRAGASSPKRPARRERTRGETTVLLWAAGILILAIAGLYAFAGKKPNVPTSHSQPRPTESTTAEPAPETTEPTQK
jgi:hypothetical protein